LRNLLHESPLNKRIQYMIEVLFAVRKDQFKANPSGLDLVNENVQYTHMFALDDPCKLEPMHDENSDDEEKSNIGSFDSDEESK
ncbi:unnamed protein product, partial [Rotaria sordida]